jgi:uncharacterized protein (TIRG00374 family)
VRAALLLGANFVLGVALLAWVLYRFGGPAVGVLAAHVDTPLLLAFLAAVALTIAVFAWRWRLLLAPLEPPPRLVTLCLFRSAGHSVGVIVPSARLGGDPLRAWLAVRAGIAPGNAIASVAVDRTLEIAAATPFSIVFTLMLIQHGIPELDRALLTVALGSAGLGLGVAMAVRRLRRGRGLVTALIRSSRLDRLRIVRSSLDVVADSEAGAARLAMKPRLALGAFGAGLLANLLVLVEYSALLAAFDLPTTPVCVVAAIFATATAHMLPVPGGVGVLEGGMTWLFVMLGHPPEVGLAVGLAVRLRELVWLLPGLAYLLAQGLGSWLGRSQPSDDPSGADDANSAHPL